MNFENPPNEVTAWDQDFSYAFLERLYKKVAGVYRVELFKNLQRCLNESQDVAFIRHDIDVSLEKALELARFEQTCGIQSNFHVMLNSPFYDWRSAENIEMLRQIISLGHEIGLHCHLPEHGPKPSTQEELVLNVTNAAQALGRELNITIHSVSFHLPTVEQMNLPIFFNSLANAYGNPLMNWYLSDSRARWREGNPLQSLENPRGRILQVLIHPIWWGEQNVRPSDRMRDFLLAAAQKMNCGYDQLNEKMFQHIIYRAPRLS